MEYYYKGTKPVRTLSDPGYYTQGCAIDYKTGDLAVAIDLTESLARAYASPEPA